MPNQYNHRAIDEIIDCVYEAAVHQSNWINTLDKISVQLDGIAPVICIINEMDPNSNQIITHSSWQQSNISYQEHYNRMNPWVHYFARCTTLGKPIKGEEIITNKELRQTEFYNDFFRKLGDWNALIAIVAAQTQTSRIVFGLHCSETTMERNLEELERLSNSLARHLPRTFEVSRRLSNNYALKATVGSIFASYSCAALIVDNQYRVEQLNLRAESLFHNEILQLDRSKGLCIRQNVSATSSLHSTIKQIMKDKGEDNPLPARIECPTVIDGMKLSITVHKYSSIGNKQLFPFATPSERALILVHDTAEAIKLPSSVLKERFQLTPKEADTANALAQGMTIEQCANERNVSINTIKTQAKSVFSKVGVSGKDELAAKFARLRL